MLLGKLAKPGMGVLRDIVLFACPRKTRVNIKFNVWADEVVAFLGGVSAASGERCHDVAYVDRSQLDLIAYSTASLQFVMGAWSLGWRAISLFGAGSDNYDRRVAITVSPV